MGNNRGDTEEVEVDNRRDWKMGEQSELAFFICAPLNSCNIIPHI